MNEELVELLRLIHHEASRAYWSSHNDCGSDWSEACKDCYTFDQCKDDKRIEELLKEMEKK